ncbi:MAG: dihydropteroate synthase [Salinivirgaceae bacterium]|nr:dihydropteroate synthase [Salinivirgaceae bacterium]
MEGIKLKIKQEIRTWNRPLVMGILNNTPDSFYSGSRITDTHSMHQKIDTIVLQGADIIDIGGMSTRPGSTTIDIKEEWNRIEPALQYMATHYPDFAVSVDTYHAEIAQQSIEKYGVDIINDISGGQLDPEMIKTVGKLGAGYIAMHMQGTPATMHQFTNYDNLITDLTRYFGAVNQRCREAGIADFIVDPGIGFSKTLDQNYHIINNLHNIAQLGFPILIGLSRKSLIYKYLDTTPEESLNATTVLNTLSILNGAQIIRVHDVKEAVETIKLITKTHNS